MPGAWPVVLWLVSGAFAADFNVNVEYDDVDSDPYDDECHNVLKYDHCSLRAAVQQANAKPGHQTIGLPEEVLVLDIVGGIEDLAASGDLDVTEDLTVTGSAMLLSWVDATALGDRVFDVRSDAHLQLEGLSLFGGTAAGGGAGGGIRVADEEGSLGAEWVGIYANWAHEDGGGIWSAGDLTLQYVAVSGNDSDEDGGGIAVKGDMVLKDSSIGANEAMAGGGGLYLESLPASTHVVTRTTVFDNKARVESGGGIWVVTNGKVQLVNSTVSHNIGFAGGGIAMQGGELELYSSTITDNGTFAGPLGTGGGVLNSDPFFPVAFGQVTLVNTIISENWDSNGTAPNCGGSQIFQSLGSNLIGDDTGCLFDAASGDAFGAPPLLGPLQYNGGVNRTHALLAGSPALDNGDDGHCPPRDQRGVNRPQGAHCDVGAFEKIP